MLWDAVVLCSHGFCPSQVLYNHKYRVSYEAVYVFSGVLGVNCLGNIWSDNRKIRLASFIQPSSLHSPVQSRRIVVAMAR